MARKKIKNKLRHVSMIMKWNKIEWNVTREREREKKTQAFVPFIYLHILYENRVWMNECEKKTERQREIDIIDMITESFIIIKKKNRNEI